MDEITEISESNIVELELIDIKLMVLIWGVLTFFGMLFGELKSNSEISSFIAFYNIKLYIQDIIPWLFFYDNCSLLR